MKRRPRKRHIQLTLDQARKPASTHGGWRPGAGRPKTRAGVSHERRATIASTHPQHVTLRIVAELPSLRRGVIVEVIRTAIARAHRPEFRVVEFVVEANHLHLIIEAASNDALARGLRGLNARIARGVNRVLGRAGKVFAERFHARALTTPREVRNALRYVLNNTRRHEPSSEFLGPTWFDPFSSGAWFTGWKASIEPDAPWKQKLLAQPSPTATARTWLLSVGWRRHAAIAFDEVPGVSRR